MANSDISAWIPEIWGREVLRHVKAYLALGRLVNRDYSQEVVSEGDTVNVPLPPTLAAQDKTAGSAVTYSAVSGATVPVILNKHKVVAFEMDDIAVMQSRPRAIENYGIAGGIALAEAIEADLLAEYANASTSVGTAGTDVVKDILLTARKNLNDAKVPLSDARFAFLSTKDAAALLDDLSTSNAGALFNDKTALRDGSMGRIYGFDTYETQLAPVVSGSPDATHGIAGHRDAVTLVTRPLTPPPAGSGVVAATFSDPDIMMTLRVLMSYDHDTMKQKVTYDVLYGVKTVRDDFMVDIVS